MATPVPTKIGKYDVVGVIGRGGMGIVYRATDPHLDRPVAIKMMTGAFGENPDILKRFFREAQSLGSLQHPNIVTVYDLGDYGGNPYLVMQYLEGEGLDAVLTHRRQLSLLDKITIIIQVCHGLSYAHRHGVVHRDIKPANIMLAKDGGIKIFDFGIAHVGHQSVTRTGQIVGTLSYMAPEQVNAQPIDARTDLFSTGVVLYQLFTNHLPFEGENTATTLLKIVHEPPPPLAKFLPSYPPEMEQVLLRALAKNPDERYSSADEFALDLAQLQGQLKQDLISQEMQEVALFLDRGEVYRAQDSLLRVVKIDQHQTAATRLLREVQQRIQREEIDKQVRGLRERAEDALSDCQFENAMEAVDRALELDRNNTELQELRESIRASALRAEKLHNALKMAEAAHAEGKLEEAKQAAEEALEVAPDDAQAKTLHRVISRDIAERSRQRQMEGYLFEARQEISSRKFTAALEILKHAEELDPAAPQVHALIESAVAGREQERRRRELESLTHEVEDALNRDDYRTACLKADEGLARFPEERNLLKLKALADRQRQLEERKQFIDEQLAVARKHLLEGRHEELQEKLEKALAQIGAEPRLQSLLAVVRENVQRERQERRKSECLQKAKESLRNQAFDDAVHTLEAMAKEMENDAEIQDLLTRARTEKAAAVQGALWRAQQESVLDVRVNILQEALRKSPQEGELNEQLHNVQDLNQFISKVAGEAKKLEEARQYDQALTKWEAVRSAYRHYTGVENTIKRVRGLRDRAHTDARQGWIEGIEASLSTCDYPQASALLGQAIQEFPWDSDLMELQERAEVGVRLRTKAQNLLAEGRKSFANQQWEVGAEIMLRAHQLATRDPLIRDQAISELTQASRTTMEKNWRASEVILRRLGEFQPSAGGSPDLQAKIQQLKREEAIAGSVEAAKGKQAGGDLAGAVRELTQALGSYPEEPQLRELQTSLEERIKQAGEAARLEKARQEKESFVLDAMDRARQAFVLDKRVEILEEALRTEAEEPRLQQQLSIARELGSRVSSLVSDARELEQSRHFDQALAKWEALAAIHRDYPDLDHILEQARRRYQQARFEAKANCLKILQLALSAADYKRAENLLTQARRDFPGDREFAEIEKMIREGMASRARAEKELVSAAKAVGKQKWRKALESFRDANAAAKTDSVIRDQVVSGLLSAADASLLSDCVSSAMLAAEAARVEPDSPLLATVRSRIEAQTRGQLAEQCLSASEGFQSAGDWQGALRSLDRGLAVYPNEPRLLESKEQIEGQIRKREEELRRVRDEDLRQREQALSQRQARDKEEREKELREKAQREEEMRKAREQELRHQQAREQEAREKESRDKESRDKELRDQELREKQQRENERRERARELEQSRQAPAPSISAERPPEAADAAATRIFVPGIKPLGPEVSAKSRAPVPPPLGITQDLTPLPAPGAKQDLPPAAPISFLHSLGTHLTVGANNLLGTKTGQTSRDAARSAKADMRTAFVESQPAHIQPEVGSDTLQEGSLPIIERQLAAFIGPLAKVLVKRAASKTTSTIELYTILATHLEPEADRMTFLARRAELSQGKVTAAAPKVSSPAAAPAAAPLDSSSPGEITPAAIEQATRRLAAHLGPIAPILAKKEGKRATTLRNLYELLAEHVANPTERARFLKEAGIQEATPPPSFLSARHEAVAHAGQIAKSEPVERTEPPLAHTQPVEESAEQSGESEPTRKAG
jgi:serine/threonine-protein kinase